MRRLVFCLSSSCYDSGCLDKLVERENCRKHELNWLGMAEKKTSGNVTNNLRHNVLIDKAF